MSGELQPTSAQERRRKGSYVVRVSDNLVVRLRHSDPMEILFSGMLKLPMLKAAQLFEDVREKFNQPGATDDDREKQMERLLEGEDKDALLKFLHAYAVKMVVEPVIVANRDDNPN